MSLTDRESRIHTIESQFAIFIRRYRRSMNELQSSELTAHEFSFLSHLHRHGQETSSHIAKAFDVSPSYATTVIDKLIRCGYVIRQRSKRDRRKVLLTVTEDGVALYYQLRSVREDYMRKVFHKLNDQELNQLSDLIAKLIE
ncbi:MarR family transcriptional regulator [Sporolactobacillus sp. Y61]|uniref:MarR family transcriptional regulator n=1 Tax=Sporolactobacillus sp. Y61 TaxID=3160863 RepID=A0AAU8IGP1_9BACL